VLHDGNTPIGSKTGVFPSCNTTPLPALPCIFQKRPGDCP
jgi:hypothetical protein